MCESVYRVCMESVCEDVIARVDYSFGACVIGLMCESVCVCVCVCVLEYV